MIIRPFTSNDVPAVFALAQKYAKAYPGVHLFPAEIYLSPAFHAGQDVSCAFDGERLLAYAPVYLQIVESGPVALPHIAWVEIRADPDLADAGPVKDALYQCLHSRVRELTALLADHRPLRMSFQYLPAETPAIAYAGSKGFSCTESVFSMVRDLTKPIPDLPAPPGVTLRHWKMETKAEQAAYVAARNECFPGAPITPGEWEYFLGSPMWAVGTSVAAFSGEELVGNVTVYWNAEENARSGVKAGFTEYIFVRPGWRGKGIAQAMIAEGMRYLKAGGMAYAHLEVLALNEGALGIYKKLGYQVIRESRFYAKMIE